MTERPILFNGAMVRAILEGRKTHTRRIAKATALEAFTLEYMADPKNYMCPFGVPGDLLWVRETWQTLQMWDHLPPCQVPTDSDIQYPATWDLWVSKRRPSIHMPRWASRITLDITGVRVERLQDITEEGAIAEGIENCDGITGAYLDYLETSAEQLAGTSALNSFRSLWDSVYKDSKSWDANPWVWDIEFRVAERRDR